MSSFLAILQPTIYSHLCSQHGFRTNHSTDTALLTVTDRVFEAMDRREITLLCLLDLSKCFDVVPHDGLLTKLERYNVDTRWFSSYLAGHQQQVVSQCQCGSRTMSAPLPNPIGDISGIGPRTAAVQHICQRHAPVC